MGNVRNDDVKSSAGRNEPAAAAAERVDVSAELRGDDHVSLSDKLSLREKLICVKSKENWFWVLSHVVQQKIELLTDYQSFLLKLNQINFTNKSHLKPPDWTKVLLQTTKAQKQHSDVMNKTDLLTSARWTNIQTVAVFYFLKYLHHFSCSHIKLFIQMKFVLFNTFQNV